MATLRRTEIYSLIYSHTGVLSLSFLLSNSLATYLTHIKHIYRIQNHPFLGSRLPIHIQIYVLLYTFTNIRKKHTTNKHTRTQKKEAKTVCRLMFSCQPHGRVKSNTNKGFSSH